MANSAGLTLERQTSDSTAERVITTALSGYHLLADPLLNKGTAFTEAERDAFGLHGLLPPTIGMLDEQVSRRLQALRNLSTDLERYAFLRDLQDTNETLFFALLVQNIEELLPIVYTPTVGAGCQEFSRLFRKPRGLFLSIPHKDRIDQILANPRFDGVEAIVVTDGERILGLGDQGANGMGIPIGKLALYTACGGLHPATTLPVVLDVGTDNQDCLADPLYIGWRHERVRGQDYDDFVEAFVSAVGRRWPHVLLQWDDFAKNNATRMLERYRNRIVTFNDDIQGTASVATGTLLSAINVTGMPLSEQRIAVMGAGSAGCGIASLILQAMVEGGLAEDEATRRFFMVDRDGLLVDGMTGIEPFQRPFLQKKAAIEGWVLDHPDKIALLDVVRHAKPTVLIGVSGQAGAFSPDDRSRYGGTQCQAGDLSAFEPDVARRGDARRSGDLDRRAGGRWHREPISFSDPRRRPIQGRSDEQFLYLSWCWTGRDRSEGATRDGRDVHGGGEGAGPRLACPQQRAQKPAAAG
jgi:malate dehydrogenase (oxaloacetate-decarboxylating)